MRLMIAACAIIALCSSAEAHKSGVPLICRDPVAKTGCYYLDTPEGQALLAEQKAAENRKTVGDRINQPKLKTSTNPGVPPAATTQPTVKTLNTGATQMKPIKGPCPVGHPTC